MVGGVLFNFLLALFIYSMILFAWGDQYIKVQEAPLGMDFNETAKSVGFQDGDILLSADGVPFERYDGDMLSQIADAREVSVIRNGAKASVYIPEDLMQRLLADSIRFASYRFPYVIDSVMVNSPAAQAGIQPGDSIIALNGTPISFSDFKEAMAERKKNAETLLKARMMERKAVIYQNWCQSHVAGKMLPIVPKPPSCLAPSFEKRYFMFPTYPFRVFTPRETACSLW